MPPSSLLITLTVYHSLFRVSHQRSLNLIQIEPNVALLAAIKRILPAGVGLQGPDEDVFFDITSQ